MHLNRRRKKRPNYGLRTVEVVRGANGFGFTISGQQPCILSCIVNNSPADQAGLRAGDFLISVNGVSVSKMAHDAVVNLIGNCPDPIKMTIAENYYSDSSDEELECGRMAGSRKPKYMHKPRPNRRIYKGVVMEPNEKNVAKLRDNIIKPRLNNNVFVDNKDSHDREQIKKVEVISNPGPMDDEAGPVEFKVLIGYLGTIEMPKQLLPNSRFQTVCSCIRKLRQEKRSPTAVLMTVLPTCLTLKNSANHIIAIYPTNRVVYVSSTTDKDCRYFGLVTSAVSDNRTHASPEVDISNSCHVFVIDPKIADHRVHLEKAENFKIHCTPDAVTGLCLEFPQNALYIVNLIQTMYKLQGDPSSRNDLNVPVVANSPQPSASSNSDSGIGYRDDCGNISDRILVVEFPTHRPLPIVNNSNRPQGIDGADLSLDAFDFQQSHELNNKYKPNNRAVSEANGDFKSVNNLNNIRAYENIKNHFENPTALLQKQNNNAFKENNRLTCRALIPSVSCIKYSDVDTGQSYSEHPVDVIEDLTNVQPIENNEFKRSVDNISVQSSKNAELGNLMNIFRLPFEAKKVKKQNKVVSSCENLEKCSKNYHKLSPKVYGVPKANHSCEELNNVNLYEDKFCYGSLQDLSSWVEQGQPRRNIAQSEPDVRIHRNTEHECDQHGGGGVSGVGLDGKRNPDGPIHWATSFEKLLEDIIGLHAFAEFLKKEFSAENIYFWTACERYRRLTSSSDRASEAERIFKQHLGSGAVEAVNVDAQGRQAAEQGLADGRADLFDIAQKQIFNLMKFDSYPRFLKSQLYKQCLAGEVFTPNFDARLSIHNTAVNFSNTPSKLKKSLSNAEDRRRKSLLPWNRRNANQRSKSRDRNELVTTQKSWDGVLTVPSSDETRRFLSAAADIHSSHSSLTSLDLASNQDSSKQDGPGEARTSLCRVLLSNGSTTVVQIKEDETIQQLVNRLLDKRGLSYSSFEVLTNKHPKSLDIAEPSIQLAGCEVTVEQRVVFKLDLPNRKIISVKSKYTKNIVDVLRPILHKYKFNLEEVNVTKAGYPVDVNLSVITIDNARLNIQLKEECDGCETNSNPTTKASKPISKLDEITNKVFEGILQEKSDEGLFKPPKSDKGSVKSEDWGSEHSSGLLGKFLRRDSAIHEKKKKTGCNRVKLVGESEEACAENTQKKPLIAKLKAGANKLHVGTYSESDELVEGLTRAQRRLEDQRGTEINFELPDFLKDKDEDSSTLTASQYYSTNSAPEPQTKIAFTKNLKQTSSPNYENQNVAVPMKTSPVKEQSPVKYTKSEGESGCSKTDPPPLPPKPKIVPIKPPNWGHSGFYKAKDVPLGKHSDMFLEQSSSSFV